MLRFDKWEQVEADPWRTDPVTDAQLRLLRELGCTPPSTLTKGEASDLISERMPPDVDELEFVRFFGFRSRRGTTQTDVRNAIKAIFAEAANRPRWDKWMERQRKARKRQEREQHRQTIAAIAHLEGRPPGRIKPKIAARRLDELLKSPAHEANYWRFLGVEPPPAPDPRVVAEMQQAITSARTIEVSYSGGSQPGTVRQRRPIKLHPPYLEAHCLATATQKTYRLDRISIPEPGGTVARYAVSPPPSWGRRLARALRRLVMG